MSVVGSSASFVPSIVLDNGLGLHGVPCFLHVPAKRNPFGFGGTRETPHVSRHLLVASLCLTALHLPARHSRESGNRLGSGATGNMDEPFRRCEARPAFAQVRSVQMQQHPLQRRAKHPAQHRPASPTVLRETASAPHHDHHDLAVNMIALRHPQSLWDFYTTDAESYAALMRRRLL